MGCSVTFRNTRSKLGLGFSAPTSRAMSMKRFDCAGSSWGGAGLRGMRPILPQLWSFMPAVTVPYERMGEVSWHRKAQQVIFNPNSESLVGKANRRWNNLPSFLAKTKEAKFLVDKRHAKRGIAGFIIRGRACWYRRIHGARCEWDTVSYLPLVCVEPGIFNGAKNCDARHIRKWVVVLNQKLCWYA